MRKIVLAFASIVTLWVAFKCTEPDPETVQPQDWQLVYDLPRSPEWRHVRGAHVRANPTCAACGTGERLNVHHIRPFHTDPALELEPSNLITLCRKHHFEIGHHSNWFRSNPDVVKDAAECLQRVSSVPSP